jgi:hypothetical protein
MAGDTGLETLVDSGQISDTAHFPEAHTFSEVLSQIDWLANNEHDHLTLVLDTANGTERLCHEEVCARDYRNDWSEKGFLSYKAGYDTSLNDWRLLQHSIDRLREKKKMSVILLSHTLVAPFNSPTTANYDRYKPALYKSTWELTYAWCDICLFFNYHVETVKEGSKFKGRGGTARVAYCTQTPAFDAKHRHGLPEEIELGSSGKEGWNNFITALKAGKAVTQ